MCCGSGDAVDMETYTQRQKSDALEKRCLQFATHIREFVRSFSDYSINFDDRDQIRRSSASIGANYIEAREAVSKPDFLFRIKTCRKEAKETAYWIELLFSQKPYCQTLSCIHLKKEIQELISIFTAIAKTTEEKYIATNRKS